MTLPLDHIHVIDLTQARSGPTAVRQLADMGAHVVKVEPRADRDGDHSRDGKDRRHELHRRADEGRAGHVNGHRHQADVQLHLRAVFGHCAAVEGGAVGPDATMKSADGRIRRNAVGSNRGRS